MTPIYANTLQTLANECYCLAGEAIVKTVRSNSEQTFFAAGFHTLYVDSSFFGGYRFGLGTELIDPQYRWDASVWCSTEFGDLIDFPSYTLLSELLDTRPENEWEEVQEHHQQQLADVCLRLTEEARTSTGIFSNLNMANFVVGIFDACEGEAEYNRLVNISVSESNINKHKIALPY